MPTYLILSTIHLSSQSIIYKALDVFHFRYVAIKEYDEDNHHQYRDEVKTLNEFSGEYYFPIFYYNYKHKNKYRIVMEYINHPQMHHWAVQHKGNCETKIKFMIRNITLAVRDMHYKDYCHLDLKYENIMYNPDTDEIKLIDFGFSQNPSIHLNKICGTPRYIAPEVMSGETYDGKKADIWAIGVILFGLLFDYYPVDSSTKDIESHTVSIMLKLLYDEVIIPHTCSIEARELLGNLLDKNPHTRYNIHQLLNSSFLD